MRSKIPISFFIGAISVLVQAQTSKILEGKVSSADGDVAATHVLNLSTKKATITDINGHFSIHVSINDTLQFSAIQFKKKTVVVTAKILDSKQIIIRLDDALEELDEVIVTPYSLTGDITKDILLISIDPVVTASTLGLPNAYVKKLAKAERELYAATANPFMSFDPLINAITGRTKLLKKRVARNNLYSRTQRVRQFFPDSLYYQELGVPYGKLEDFFYYCEIDTTFQSIVDSHDILQIWEYMEKRSVQYRTNNDVE